jgi:hypothetical protein
MLSPLFLLNPFAPTSKKKKKLLSLLTMAHHNFNTIYPNGPRGVVIIEVRKRNRKEGNPSSRKRGQTVA